MDPHAIRDQSRGRLVIALLSFLQHGAAGFDDLFMPRLQQSHHLPGTGHALGFLNISQCRKSLVSNKDDHLKKHGFIYAGDDRWRLSPAFDTNPSPSRHRVLETGIIQEEASPQRVDLLRKSAAVSLSSVKVGSFSSIFCLQNFVDKAGALSAIVLRY